MFTTFEIILIATAVTVGFYAVAYAVVYGTWWALTTCVSWLWGLLRTGKNKKVQTKEVSWSEADKRHLENFKEAVKYHDI